MENKNTMKKIIQFRIERTENYKQLVENCLALKTKFEKELYKTRFEEFSEDLWNAVFCVLKGNTAEEINKRFDFRNDDLELVDCLLQCYSDKKICVKGDKSVPVSEKQVSVIKEALSAEVVRRNLKYRNPTLKEAEQMIKENRCNKIVVKNLLLTLGYEPVDFASEIETEEYLYDNGEKIMKDKIKAFDSNKLLKVDNFLELYIQSEDVEVKPPFKVSDLKLLRKRLEEICKNTADYRNQFASRKNEQQLAIIKIFQKASASDSADDCHLIGSIFDLFGLIDDDLKADWHNKNVSNKESRKQWIKAIFQEVDKYQYLIENQNPSYTKNMLLPLEYATLKIITGRTLFGKRK